ncbi:uncharacterized protein LOC126894993 [Daktulosphaira vitifoliae]|uniref:uncharacterized protein LOC126894993 n=1 Tax=Daktulosphaira vitifoliae TaxID=58002 RepID=UPI0021AACD83|nr:uncharacterized protein LOC126894993 [Daktulosphaira vitifoliae]
MAGSLATIAKFYNKQTFAKPQPHSELIDCTDYVLNFNPRKFVQIGLDPKDRFNVTIRLLSSTRYILITIDFLQRIYTLMGNILSLIFDPVSRQKIILLKDEYVTLSKTTFQGESSLVFELQAQDECRVLLTQSDILKLSALECCIFETINQKMTVIQPLVLQQLEQMAQYMKSQYEVNVENKCMLINAVSDYTIRNSLPNSDLSYISQIKQFASQQLEQRWTMLEEYTKEMSSNGENVCSTFFGSLADDIQSEPIIPSNTNNQEIPTVVVSNSYLSTSI